jgi:hypothetical protein
MRLLDWSDRSRFNPEPKPCVLCDKPAHMISDRGKPVHKVCAEEWIEQHTLPANRRTTQ